jgi:hypothetical protein
MKRVGDWRPDTTLLGIEAKTKCLCPVNDPLDSMLNDWAMANKGAIIKVPSVMHFLGTCREQEGRKEGNDYIQDQPLGLKRTAIT